MRLVFKWVVTYTACPLRKLTWIVISDTAKIDIIFETSKYLSNNLIFPLVLEPHKQALVRVY